jgi:diguanylate cyclase (GGDEF)-like protein
MRQQQDVLGFDLSSFALNGGALAQAEEVANNPSRLIWMSIHALLRRCIRRYGEFKTIAVLTLLLVGVVAGAVAITDLILYQSIHPDIFTLSTLMTLFIGPVILHVFVSLISKLDRSEEKLRALSVMDDLTDVYNRRFFIEQAEKELAKAKRYGTVFSILAVDIDHFKKINDTYGHFAGDTVLQAMANTCMNNLRAMDIFARFGGEEFMFLIPEANKTDVASFAERVLSALENTLVVYNREEIRFTVSIGVKTVDARINSLESLLKAADDALYEAKRRGRNCIVIYDDEATFLPENRSRTVQTNPL